jgi:hypothetical protein
VKAVSAIGKVLLGLVAAINVKQALGIGHLTGRLQYRSGAPTPPPGAGAACVTWTATAFAEGYVGNYYDNSTYTEPNPSPYELFSVTGDIPPGLIVTQVNQTNIRIHGVPTTAGTYYPTFSVSGPSCRTVTTRWTFPIGANPPSPTAIAREPFAVSLGSLG